MPSPVLVVENLHKRFGSLEVLKGISLRLEPREILGIVGPSGSGKSTLLRCLNLLEWPSEGSIHYPASAHVRAEGGNLEVRGGGPGSGALGEPEICAVRRGIGYVFQAFNLWEDRSVLGNLTLAPRVVLGESGEETEKRAKALCAQFGISDKLHARIGHLSGGQKQRVAIIRALMMRPSLILLDEVTSALDPLLTVDVMQAIRLLREDGLAMILVTHHLEFASGLCDRIMYLSKGQVVQTDTPAKLRSEPANDEVRTFLEVLQRAR